MIYLNCESIKEKTAVALGIFDGVHQGHRVILDTAKQFKSKGLSFGIFTFKTSTVKTKHGKPYEYIYSDAQKNYIFEQLSADYVYSPSIDELRDMDGQTFAREILRNKMNAQVVVCGENFRFGKNAACTVKQLDEFGKQFGFEVYICETLKKDGEAVSSGKIKEYLKSGLISKANDFLGENYFIKGEIITGNKIGRTIDFPTLNQAFEQRQIIPKKGAYATRINIDCKNYCGVTNIGVKPTVEKDIQPLSETHVCDFSGNLYGENIKVEFIDFLREEQKFPSLEHLKKQIEADVNKAKEKFFPDKY